MKELKERSFNILREAGGNGLTFEIVIIKEGKSKNGTYYPKETLLKSRTLFEGAKVAYYEHNGNFDHLSEEAKSAGLVVVVWSYPRGSGISKAGETGVDVVAYAAQIAAQLGAHIIKVKLPSEHVEQEEAKKAYVKNAIPISTLADRVRHVVQSSFDGRRVVIFSGGAKKDNDEDVVNEARAIRDGGGFGSIIGRNSFQRKKPEAIKLLKSIMAVYAGDAK